MKKTKKVTRKLVLARQTVRRLSRAKLQEFAGGTTGTALCGDTVGCDTSTWGTQDTNCNC